MLNINYLKAGFLFSILWVNLLHIHVILSRWYSKIQFTIPVFIFGALLAVSSLVFHKLWNLKILLQQKPVYLELTPPAFTEKTAYTTQQLIAVLHNMGMQRTLFDKLHGRKVSFSFEIISTKEQGIRYIIKTTSNEAAIIERIIVSYLPQVRVKQINEYLPK